MIQFSGVSKKYGGVTVIENLDLEIAKGEFCVLIGASGSGKSTPAKSGLPTKRSAVSSRRLFAAKWDT
jgi:ABC-type multidrug transport system ATPase subunit